MRDRTAAVVGDPWVASGRTRFDTGTSRGNVDRTAHAARHLQDSHAPDRHFPRRHEWRAPSRRRRNPGTSRARAALARRLRRQRSVPAPVAGTHTVSATVSGLRHSYDGTTLRNNGGDDLRVYADGTYTFATAVADGNAYAVTVSAQPTGPAQTCTVANGSGTVSGSDIGNVAVNCPFATAYAVGGSVSGLAGNGLRLEYDADNVSLPAAITVAANGSFVFDAATTSAIAGTAYRLRILAQPTGPAQTCILTGGTGTVAAADVSSVAVGCDNHLVRINLTGMRDTT